ncbi:hypothetical protein AAFF_G00091440 [Aldrovandia affinis]|uniref:Uncharacterized protein n=1 Tax=Aldrovandia affinis TaxID=143900 RepID=A0AAD7R1F9_9TELE|nr:hypothetical protein AAFF_G00091440 [Aldrovandia affinis]
MNTIKLPADWLEVKLPHLLDEICAIAASVQQDYKAGHSGMSEPAIAGGRAGAAAGHQGGGTRLSGLRPRERGCQQGDTSGRFSMSAGLCLLGFSDMGRCEEALRLRRGSGCAGGCLQCMSCPAGRCELALSLLQDQGLSTPWRMCYPGCQGSHMTERLYPTGPRQGVPICLSVFPHSKVLSLTSCQCSVCCDCFQQHFTIAVRDKHIRDMVCPVCWEPDINDPEHLNSYFSTLDIQCSYRFIYDGDQLKVTCFQWEQLLCPVQKALGVPACWSLL